MLIGRIYDQRYDQVVHDGERHGLSEVTDGDVQVHEVGDMHWCASSSCVSSSEWWTLVLEPLRTLGTTAHKTGAALCVKHGRMSTDSDMAHGRVDLVALSIDRVDRFVLLYMMSPW